MKQAQLLDELARCLDEDHRYNETTERTRKAFAAYTESLKVSWWKRIWRKQNKETRPFWV
jgi:hypothetical protein